MKKTYQEPDLQVVGIAMTGRIADPSPMKYNSDTHVDKDKEALGNERRNNSNSEWGNLW